MGKNKELTFNFHLAHKELTIQEDQGHKQVAQINISKANTEDLYEFLKKNLRKE